MSAGTDMALPGKGRALSAAQASSQAAALRDVMKTFEQPAWMRLFNVNLDPYESTQLAIHTQRPHGDQDLEIRL
jgi:hypothetical protein